MAGTSTPRPNSAAGRPTCRGLSVWSRLPGPILGPVRTGILGGTFDPIHIGHLHAGETALHQAALNRVLFLPAGDPWQKSGSDVSEATHRLAMTRLAVDGVPGFEVDDRETMRDGPTYTIDTLETFPEDEELFLILGADAAVGIPTWHRAEDVLERATVLVVPRAGADPTGVVDLVPRCVFLDMGVLEVSGTEIRAKAAAGEPYRFLVPAPVFDYIEVNSLYSQADRPDSVGSPSGLEESS